MKAASPKKDRNAVSYVSILRGEFSRRQERNSRYSIRAFARHLELSDGALSQILSAKRIPSLRTAEKLLQRLDLSPEDRRHFLGSLAETQRSRGLLRLNPVFQTLAPSGERPKDLTLDLFKVIADWYHVALLELTFVESFRAEPKWIASQLGISLTEAKFAIGRLTELGLIEERDGTLAKSETRLTTADKQVTTPALKRHQRQMLEKALDSLENDPLESRSTTGMTMAIDPARLPEAKKLIDEFSLRLCEFLEAGPRKKVYQLSLSLFPLQRSLS